MKFFGVFHTLLIFSSVTFTYFLGLQIGNQLQSFWKAFWITSQTILGGYYSSNFIAYFVWAPVSQFRFTDSARKASL